MDSQVFYEWRRSRDPSTSPNWYFPHNCVNILRTGVVVCVCVCFWIYPVTSNSPYSLNSKIYMKTDSQASNFYLGKSFQDVQGDGCLIIFLWMKSVLCKWGRFTKRERTWRPLLLLDCTDTAAIYLLPHPLIRGVCWGRGGWGETPLGISQAILCQTGPGFGFKSSLEKAWLKECTLFKGMYPRIA